MIKTQRKAFIMRVCVLFSLLTYTLLICAQDIILKGIVHDEFDDPLPGAAIKVVGSPRGVMTDNDGSFTIEVKSSDKLEVSFIGYQPYTFTVGQQRNVNIKLAPLANELDEVTIVAFGKQKKSSVIASIESVKMDNLKVPASNLTTALAGKIPGLISYQMSGEPGADNAQFFVRGVTTFGYKSDPLILIDGFEATTDDLARMQPDDIESFSILKDASATALYGARGANGIIMVSTKSGREGTVKINARVDVHVATPTRMNKTLDGVSYMRLYNEARMTREPNLGPFYSEQKIQSTMRGEDPMIYPNIDWYDMLFNKHTINTKANVNVSGGGKVATYYVSGGFDNESGLLKVDKRNNFNNNINIDRFHIRTNVNFKLTETTKLDTRVQGRFEKYTGPYVSAKDIFKQVMWANPVDFPAYYEPDEANRYTKHILFGSSFTGGGIMDNPYANMVRGYEDRNESTMTAMATLSQDFGFITEGLMFQLKASVNVWSKYSSKRTYNPFLYDIDTYNQVTGEYKLYNLNPNGGRPYLGDVEPGRDATAHYYFEARINWDRTFGKHTVGAMAVAMGEEKLLTDGKSLSIYETLPEKNLGTSGRITYDYDTRYFLEFAYGYNGSEKFTGDKQFGFFPSIGAGWLISNEPYYGSGLTNALPILKLKATVGKVGNDAIANRADRFFFLSDITKGGHGYRFGEQFMTEYGGYSINRYANPDITWEVSTKYNLGLEASFLRDGQLKFMVDFFKDYRSQIYMERKNFPSTAGLENTIRGNVGKVNTQGIDASLDYEHFFNKDFWMTGRANFTYSTNKYVELDEKNYPDEYLKKVGYNVNQWWGLIAERLFVDENEIANSPKQDFGAYMAGDIKYLDVNGDGVIDNNDMVPIGYPTVPEIQYGFGLSTGFKNFDFSFFFQGNARVSIFINPGVGGGSDGTEGIAPFIDRRNALSFIADDYWSETNPNVHAFWPRLSTSTIDNNIKTSTWWMRNGAFLRMKSMELGYTFTKTKKLPLESCRIYFNTENLFVISAFKFWDPEQGRNGLGYPLNKRFNMGIQLSF